MSAGLDTTTAPDVAASEHEPAGAGLPTPEAPATPSPEPFLHGKFALFQLPDGGVLLAYRVKGSTEDRQLMIPPFILQMAGQASGLQPSDILARLQSGDLGV